MPNPIHARCVCGAEIVSQFREGCCSACGRGFVLEWGQWATREDGDRERIDRKLEAMKHEKRNLVH
jgi:hypothetical protein